MRKYIKESFFKVFKQVIIPSIIPSCIAILVIILVYQAGQADGRKAGIRHAIEDSAVFVIEYSDDQRTFKVVEDMEVWIALDEDLYTHRSSFSAR